MEIPENEIIAAFNRVPSHVWQKMRYEDFTSHGRSSLRDSRTFPSFIFHNHGSLVGKYQDHCPAMKEVMDRILSSYPIEKMDEDFFSILKPSHLAREDVWLLAETHPELAKRMLVKLSRQGSVYFYKNIPAGFKEAWDKIVSLEPCAHAEDEEELSLI